MQNKPLFAALTFLAIGCARPVPSQSATTSESSVAHSTQQSRSEPETLPPAAEPTTPGRPISASLPAPNSKVALLADSQLHHPFGRQLRSAGPLADRHISRTSVRPAELNLLAPLLLDETLKQAAAQVGPAPHLAVYLGDATNIACASEFSRFVDAMNGAWPGKLWLMAHGNHDSFLMGNFSKYVPAEVSPQQVAKGAMPWPPSDEHRRAWHDGLRAPDGAWHDLHRFLWWTADESARLGYQDGSDYGWPGICAGPRTNDGPLASWSLRTLAAPANKLAWTAMYAAHLRDLGATFKATGAQQEGGARPILACGAAGSTLGALKFELLGQWHPPTVRQSGPTSDLQTSWNTFVVQAIDVGPSHRLILLDTSVGGGDILGRLPPKKMAGLHGQLGPEQLAALDSLASNASAKGKTLVLAGHVPIHHLNDGQELLARMRKLGITSYYSAHTHCDASERSQDNGVREFNIGSTTDDPSQFAIADFASKELAQAFKLSVPLAEGQALPVYKAAVLGAQVKFAQSVVHLAAARALQAQSPATWGGTYSAPKSVTTCTPEQCGADAALLIKELSSLESKIKTDPQFRSLMLGIALAASKTEGAHCDH